MIKSKSTINEFILWGNCNNNCIFCLQKQMDIPYLSKNEMLNSILLLRNKLNEIPNYTDVLLLGGEILYPYYHEINNALQNLWYDCLYLISINKIDLLYINTNLLYENKTNLDFFLELFKDYKHRIKLITSYDVCGRFINNEDIFFNNLNYIIKQYKYNITVNCIITQELINFEKTNKSLYSKFLTLGVEYVNYMPYINELPEIEFKDILHLLIKINKEYNGFLKFYINNFDSNTMKYYYKYVPEYGYILYNNNYSSCGHANIYRQVLKSHECFLCKLNEVFL